MYRLILDIGNTNTKMGLFDEQLLLTKKIIIQEHLQDSFVRNFEKL